MWKSSHPPLSIPLARGLSDGLSIRPHITTPRAQHFILLVCFVCALRRNPPRSASSRTAFSLAPPSAREEAELSTSPKFATIPFSHTPSRSFPDIDFSFFHPFTPPTPSSSPLLRLVIMVACVEYCLLHLHVPELPPIRCCFITPFPTLCDLPRSACRPLWSDFHGRSNLGRLLDLSLRRPTHGRAIWCETARNMNATSGINKNKIQNN